MSSSEHIYIDGSFDYATSFFKQIFTFHGYFNGCYIPLSVCLLKDKPEITYTYCFKKLCILCNEKGFVFNPSAVVVDFDTAIHNSIKNVWPEAWFRKIQELGLVLEYKTKNSPIGEYLRTCFGLMFLSPTDVKYCFSFALLSVIPFDDKVIKFAEYLTSNYIRDEARYSPQIWASNSAELTRTTNACKSFHSHFN